MKLYLQLVRLFLGAGAMVGLCAGILMATTTGWTAGLAYGLFSGTLLALIVPVFLVIAGRKNRAAKEGGN